MIDLGVIAASIESHLPKRWRWTDPDSVLDALLHRLLLSNAATIKLLWRSITSNPSELPRFMDAYPAKL